VNKCEERDPLLTENVALSRRARPPISGTSCLRQVKTVGAGEGKTHPCCQADAMADGDINRPNRHARAQDGTDDLAGVDQGRPAAALRRRVLMGADQTGLGNTDRRQVGEDGEVTRKTEAARMGKAMAIAEEEDLVGCEAAGGRLELRPSRGRTAAPECTESKPPP
jgi:hypothetical protein